jgi:ABC-type antimicrobial peptide transport system permease subunit
MASGVRFAFTDRDRSAAALPTTLAGTALLVAALVGALTFGLSMQRLVTEPPRYGLNYDFSTDNGASEIPAETLALLLSSAIVEGVTNYAFDQARVGEQVVPVFGMTPVRGQLYPVLLRGQLPAGPDEVAIGRISARDLGVTIGDRVTFTSADGQGTSFEVSGYVVPPGLGGNDVIGVGAVVTDGGFLQLGSDPTPRAAVVKIRPGAPRDDVVQLAEEIGLDPSDAGDDRPGAILSLSRVTFVPFTVAGLLALLVALIVVNAVFTSVRRQDRSIGIIRSLGADGWWTTRAASWQSVALVAVPVLVGAPLGIVAGRFVFRRYAENLGTVESSSIPAGNLLVGLAILLVVALLAGNVAGRPARRVRPAALLRAE